MSNLTYESSFASENQMIWRLNQTTDVNSRLLGLRFEYFSHQLIWYTVREQNFAVIMPLLLQALYCSILTWKFKWKTVDYNECVETSPLTGRTNSWKLKYHNHLPEMKWLGSVDFDLCNAINPTAEYNIGWAEIAELLIPLIFLNWQLVRFRDSKFHHTTEISRAI